MQSQYFINIVSSLEIFLTNAICYQYWPYFGQYFLGTINQQYYIYILAVLHKCCEEGFPYFNVSISKLIQYCHNSGISQHIFQCKANMLSILHQYWKKYFGTFLSLFPYKPITVKIEAFHSKYFSAEPTIYQYFYSFGNISEEWNFGSILYIFRPIFLENY